MTRRQPNVNVFFFQKKKGQKYSSNDQGNITYLKLVNNEPPGPG